MLFQALSQAGATCSAANAGLAEEHATELMPEVLPELLQKCEGLRGAAGGEAPFGSPEARRRLASMVQQRYLGRGAGEPVKLCTALKFVRTHALTPLLEDEAILRPVLSSF
eukprot:16207391-Heterocapsa_arctica.AAC.1